MKVIFFWVMEKLRNHIANLFSKEKYSASFSLKLKSICKFEVNTRSQHIRQDLFMLSVRKPLHFYIVLMEDMTLVTAQSKAIRPLSLFLSTTIFCRQMRHIEDFSYNVPTDKMKQKYLWSGIILSSRKSFANFSFRIWTFKSQV